jgi:hypothetical protein
VRLARRFTFTTLTRDGSPLTATLTGSRECGHQRPDDALMAKVNGDRILMRHHTGVTWEFAYEQLNLVDNGIVLPRGATATPLPSRPSPSTSWPPGRAGGSLELQP